MIEIYGVKANEDFRCGGCDYIQNLLEEQGIPYSFIDITKYDEVLKCNILDRDKIVLLAQRAGFRHLRITYPVIFEDEKSKVPLNIKELKEKLKL